MGGSLRGSCLRCRARRETRRDGVAVRVLTIGLLLTALAACETVGDVVGTGFNAELSGTPEVPGPGDPDGRGFAEVSVVGRFDRPTPSIVAYRGHHDQPPWTIDEIAAQVSS